MSEISKIPVLTENEEYELFTSIAAGNESARKTAITHNLKLVVSIVRKEYGSYFFNMGMDLIQAGNVGLINAVDNFDVNNGTKFSTYASSYIHKECWSLLHKNSPIYIPQTAFWEILRIKKKKNELSKKLEHEATIEELCEYASCSKEMAKTAIELSPISLDAEEDDDDCMVKKQTSKDDVENEVIDVLYYEKLMPQLFKRLNEREQKIIKLYYGFDGPPLTLNEIGQIQGIAKNGGTLTRERVRKIIETALNKMSQCSYLVAT